ncbi:MAG TPA: DUF2520 domain-containing protein [Gemmatirosa sp.]
MFVIGAGRAGRSLAIALDAARAVVLGITGRERPFPRALAAADVVLVAAPDTAVAGVLDDLAGAPDDAGPASSAVVLQLSGVRPSDASDERLRARVAGVGTFHPLVPLADPGLGAARLRGAWIGIGGDPVAVAVATQLAHRLGARTLSVPDDPSARAVYHAAAVFASNFPVVLAATAERLFAAAGVDAEGARGAVRHLLASAAANVGAAAETASALTGPVARGDAATVARHLAALAGHPDADALYRSLARATVDLARGPDPPHRAALERIDTLLG